MNKYYFGENSEINAYDSVMSESELYGDNHNNLSYIFKSHIDEINQYLDGGFKQKYIYELQGPSLCGKSLLITYLIANNIHASSNNNNKIMLIDSNDSYSRQKINKMTTYLSNHSENIDTGLLHITHITDFKQLNQYLSCIKNIQV